MTSVAKRTVYCEGKSQSIDVRFLTALFSGMRPATAIYNPKVEPIGGKSGWNTYFQFHGASDYVALGDRDFDLEPLVNASGKAQLQKRRGRDDKPEYVTGFTCLECYFLNVEAMDEYLQNRLSHIEIRDSLIEVAQILTPYFAVRWAFQKLRESGIYCPGLGDITVDASERNCLREAQERIKTYHTNVEQFHNDATNKITQAMFEAHYKGFISHFRNADFIDNAEYRLWFDGKALLNRWFGLIPSRANATGFMDYCLQNDLIDFEQFPDLIAFRDICWH